MSNGDKIDARGTQGFINKPQGSVEVQHGDQETLNSGGGAIAQRDLDQRQGFFIDKVVFGADASNLSSDQASQILMRLLEPLLNQITQAGNQASVDQAYQAALPQDAELFRTKATENPSILAQLDEFNKLRDFVMHLSEDETVPEQLRLKLKAELVGCEAQSASESQPSSPSSAGNATQKLTPYLMVVLQPTSNDGQLLVNAWLIADGAAATSLEQFQPLDLEEAQKGATCGLAEVPSIIDQFLKKSREYLRGKHCCPIALEIFLPLEYLCSEVERWEVSIRRNRMQPLGTQHPVILRSYERLELDYLDYCWTEWCENWEQMKMHLSITPSHELFEKLEEVESCDWDAILYNYREKVEKIGFIIPCLPSEEKQEALFNAMLDASVPIALWIRKAIPDFDHITEFTELLKAGPLKDLPECIRKLRERAHVEKKAVDTDYAYHLSILWEDPNRLPPDVMIQLQSPG